MKSLLCTSVYIWILLLFFFDGYSQNGSYLDYVPTIFEGSTVVDKVYSPALEGNLLGDPPTQPLTVILPPGYELYPNNKYPVVYFLHGYTEDYTSYTDDFLRKLNHMIGNKIISPVILVKPNSKNKYDGSYYTNSYVSGNWEDYIVQDVRHHVENNYNTLNQKESRGLTGHSMGVYGTIKFGMKYPSLWGAIATMSGEDVLDLEESLLYNSIKNNYITAAQINEYRPSDPYTIRYILVLAVAFAPDSSSRPLMGRLPYSSDGKFIDSIWQKWLIHDPTTMLSFYNDSLQKINAIQIFVGNDDYYSPFTESFHQHLQVEGIEHGYDVFEGGHNPSSVLDKVLSFFSEKLIGVVPTVKSLSDYYLEGIDKLMVEMNLDGKLYIVPTSAGYGIDSINKYQLASTDVLANESYEFQLLDLEYGKYQVYAISGDTLVSNIPAEFVVVPDKSDPQIYIENDSVNKGDPITLSLSRGGTICLVSCDLWGCDTLTTISEILKPSILKDSTEVLAEMNASFETDDLFPRSYMIYGFDQYGIISEPKMVQVMESTGIPFKSPLKISISPNPAQSLLTVQTNRNALYELTIVSINGQRVYNNKFEGTTHQLDLTSFQKGVYFITIRSKDFITTRKVVKL